LASGKGNQRTKQVGEYLVAAELCRRGFISTTFSGNVPEFDIVAVDESLKTIPIQVKTIKVGGGFQFDANDYLQILMSDANETQEIQGLRSLPHPDMIYVMVVLEGQNQDNFYLCRNQDIQQLVHDNYVPWLQNHGGKRPRNWMSTHCTVWPKQLQQYKNNWQLLTGTLR